jgi:UDP-glucuronate decarboxylase
MVDVRIARIFNTYGPNMSPDDGRVVSNFIVQALKGNDITIYGDGQQTRCFCYVDDMVRGFLHLVNSPTVGLGPVNLGNPVEYTVEQLANFVITLTKSSSKIIFKDLPVDDPLKRKPDISKARERLGWAPEIDIDEGLQNTIDYFDGLNRKGKL